MIFVGRGSSWFSWWQATLIFFHIFKIWPRSRLRRGDILGLTGNPFCWQPAEKWLPRASPCLQLLQWTAQSGTDSQWDSLSGGLEGPAAAKGPDVEGPASGIHTNGMCVLCSIRRYKVCNVLVVSVETFPLLLLLSMQLSRWSIPCLTSPLVSYTICRSNHCGIN